MQQLFSLSLPRDNFATCRTCGGLTRETSQLYTRAALGLLSFSLSRSFVPRLLASNEFANRRLPALRHCVKFRVGNQSDSRTYVCVPALACMLYTYIYALFFFLLSPLSFFVVVVVVIREGRACLAPLALLFSPRRRSAVSYSIFAGDFRREAFFAQRCGVGVLKMEIPA